jgi:hypothetical protein
LTDPGAVDILWLPKFKPLMRVKPRGRFFFWKIFWRLKMNNTKLSLWVRALHLTVGGVAMIQAAVFLFALYRSVNSSHKSLLFWAQIVLASSEIIAALLFLIPQTFVFGTRALLMVFLFAIVLHAAHGEFNIGALLVYSVAVLVVKAHRNLRKDQPR